MKCTEPSTDVGTEFEYNGPSINGCPADNILFQLLSQSTELADTSGNTYDYQDFKHTFLLKAYDLSGAGTPLLGQVIAFQQFDVTCEGDTDIITSFHSPSDSLPPGSGSPPLISSEVSFSTCARDFKMCIVIFSPELVPNFQKNVNVISWIQGHIEITTNGNKQTLTLPNHQFGVQKLALMNAFASEAI